MGVIKFLPWIFGRMDPFDAQFGVEESVHGQRSFFHCRMKVPFLVKGYYRVYWRTLSELYWVSFVSSKFIVILSEMILYICKISGYKAFRI